MEKKWIFIGLVVLELIFIVVLISFLPNSAIANPGQSVTVKSQLEIGNVWPEILSVEVNDGADIVLIPNNTKIVACIAIVRDFNGHGDIKSVEAQFFDSTSSWNEADAGNSHYTNSSCDIDTTYGDEYTARANCTFNVQYYAKAGEWNCSVLVNDTYDWTDFNYNLSNVSELLAIGLPEVIDYGTVNATFVSDESIAEVINYGNVMLNLTLSGYARTEGDNLAMNCTVGSIGEIPIYYEKFNLSTTTAGPLTLSEFENFYINLTSIDVVRRFNLDYKKDDTPTLSTKDSFWRIYVPRGVAGTCEGNIVFGAIQQNEA
jgi:hypothetical protein